MRDDERSRTRAALCRILSRSPSLRRQVCVKGSTAGFTTCHESGCVTLLGYAPYLTSSVRLLRERLRLTEWVKGAHSGFDYANQLLRSHDLSWRVKS